MNESSQPIECNAITTKEISGICINTVPTGTKFKVKIYGNDKTPSIFPCSGLGITSIWRDEFEFLNVEDKVITKESK
jgi:hypothetical protein